MSADDEACIWSEDDDGNYETLCGQAFTFIDGGPVENCMRFCCYCGGPLTCRPFAEQECGDEP